MARAYRLKVGTSPGADDLDDSGEIHVTRRFVPDLPVGVPLFGRLETRIAGRGVRRTSRSRLLAPRRRWHPRSPPRCGPRVL